MFNLNQVRLLVSFDSLGAPGIGGSDFVAIIGSERFAGLREMMGDILDSLVNPPVQPAFVSRASLGSLLSDSDPFVAAGVPAVWFTQSRIQNYHGGQLLMLGYLLKHLE